ncbi:hypothetical protein OIE13_05870 [Streptosporangium sp. NBC_01810]|nr:hypothetical protein [Streptosporangium sp. NBC_01810]WSA27400.1 hypothetical protein OIE13_05870 [Streptosporangium sp. NBC_01810]
MTATNEDTVHCPHCGGTFRRAFYHAGACPSDPKNAKKTGK